VNFGLLEQSFFTTDISHTFCQSARKFGRDRGLANRKLFPNFVNFGPGSRDIMHATTCVSPSMIHL